jgi:hypothetical protein
MVKLEPIYPSTIKLIIVDPLSSIDKTTGRIGIIHYKEYKIKVAM